MFIKEGSKVVIDGVSTLMHVACDIEAEYFVKKVYKLYGNIAYINSDEDCSYFVTVKKEEKADMRFLYEIKDTSGVTRKIALSKKSIVHAMEEYKRVYKYDVESITYIESIHIF
jgi:hypothetical protein